jgi:hypothetical protein
VKMKLYTFSCNCSRPAKRVIDELFAQSLSFCYRPKIICPKGKESFRRYEIKIRLMSEEKALKLLSHFDNICDGHYFSLIYRR